MSEELYYEKLSYAVLHYANRLERALEIEEVKNGSHAFDKPIQEKVKEVRVVADILREKGNEMIIANNLTLICQALRLIISDAESDMKVIESNLMNIGVGLESQDLKIYRELSEQYHCTDSKNEKDH